MSLPLHDVDCCTDSSDVDGELQPLAWVPERKKLVYVFNEKYQQKYKARIIRLDKKRNRVKVHYIQYNKRYDEWVDLRNVTSSESSFAKTSIEKECHLSTVEEIEEVHKECRI